MLYIKFLIKSYYQSNREKLQNDPERITEIFQKIKTFKKEIMLILEKKVCEAEIEEEQKNIWKINTMREKICVMI